MARLHSLPLKYRCFSSNRKWLPVENSTWRDFLPGFHTGFLLGGGNNALKCPPIPPPWKKPILETSEIAFQAYLDQKLVLTDLWLKNTYLLNKCGISACRLAVLSN